MGWNKIDYADWSRRWSLLRFIHETMTGAAVRDLKSKEVALRFTPASPGAAPSGSGELKGSNFRVRRPAVNFNRPLIFLENAAGSKTGSMGSLEFTDSYLLGVIAPTWNTDATVDDGDRDLDCWLSMLRGGLHGKQIPFYDYSIPATPVRDKSGDFEVQYASHRRESEKGDGQQNLLTMDLSIIVK